MLRITKQTDYAIVLMTQLAGRREGVQNARDLARVVNLPLPTVSKILKAMTRAALVVSHRGVKGGYSLAKDPKDITIADLVEALEGPIAITECLDEINSDCDIECSCPTRTNWQRVNNAVRGALAAIPLSEMTTFTLPVPEMPQKAEV